MYVSLDCVISRSVRSKSLKLNRWFADIVSVVYPTSIGNGVSVPILASWENRPKDLGIYREKDKYRSIVMFL